MLLNALEKSWDILAKSPDEKMLPAMKLLHEHLENPRSYVTLAGETSSGKSTLINAFLGRKFLAAKARPTTGTVTWIDYGASSEEKLYAINRDATIEEIDYPTFLSLAEKPDEDLLRLKATLPADRNEFKGINIFDTPGFNSIVAEHAEVLREFLPESDVIVFPVSYRVGFGSCDQQLMNMIYDIGEKFGRIPVILVVNRVPAGIRENDKRIAEIRSHAEDSLHDKVKLLIVNAAAPDASGNSKLPDAATVWKETAAVAFSDERRDALAAKSKQLLQSLFEQRIGELDGNFAALEAGKEGIRTLQKSLDEMEQCEKQSFQIVDKYMDRLKRELLRLLGHGVEQIKGRVSSEIGNSSKWTEIGACRAFVFGHIIPFETAKCLKAIDQYVYDQFLAMDEELSQMANTTLYNIDREIDQTTNPQIKQLLQNLALKIGRRLVGDVATSALRGMGGACGTAAGLGNLVKMLVKNIGKIFGKKFGKEVYTQIGKIFTKKAVNAMALALQAVIEGIDYVYECMTWQKTLTKESFEILDQWQRDVTKEFSGSMIPLFGKENYENVKAVYKELKDEVKQTIATAQSEHSANEVNSWRKEKQVLLDAMKELEE